MRKRPAILLAVAIMLFAATGGSFAAFPLSSKNSAIHALPEGYVNSGIPEVAIQQYRPLEKAAGYRSPSEPPHRHKHKSQLVALILCIGLGALGIHRYYLGYFWQGIVQTMTVGGCLVWTIIDLVRIITGGLQPKDDHYDKTL